MVHWAPRAVGWVAWTTAGMALVAPASMLARWPQSKAAPEYLMQGWALSTLAVALTLWGARPETAATALCIGSVPWDLKWGGRMGWTAAALNTACAGALLAGRSG